ncbi:MAG TPA: phosphoglycerate kinase [Caldithrix abyssi]|uniref:Phosphoglycerate kinase n=1 Tax=Caldithrix abyssi TaxID=187145 RepID=A0A7V1LJU8_CALAY|nr:phosphoglycerate kinase [Caldithrix abyssi]
MAKLTLDRLETAGKKVLVRCDFNVPLNEKQEITDDRRIQASLPTIRYILDQGGSAVLCSHLGRPKGEVVETMRLKPVAERLSRLLGREVIMAPDSIGAEVRQLKEALKPGQVLLLENLRFHKGETKNDPEMARQLAAGCDLYVNDAFGTAHRAHASTVGVTAFFERCAAGFLIARELKFLGEAIEKPQSPFVAILGGAKISGKIDVIKNLIGKVDVLLIGGGMAYTFLKAQGFEIGDSLLEEDKIELAREIIRETAGSKTELYLPEDVVAADRFDNEADRIVVESSQIPAGRMGLDIGPKTRGQFGQILKEARTIVWNGPMGVFEMPSFAVGTRAVAEAMAEATAAGAVTIVGGGDSAAAVSQFNMEERFSHISTGGGASLEFLEGKQLPGIAALTDI